MAVVRFFVGEDEEKAIVRLNQKMFANFDLIPPGASAPLIKPRSIDDVPILSLTLWSRSYGDYELRRLAAQNMAEEEPSALVQWLFYSHPPIRDRIAAAQAFRH